MVTSVSITANGREIAALYERRAARLLRVKGNHLRFAITLHNIRKKKIEELIYQKTPYSTVTKNLLDSERVLGDMVYNVAPYANIRAAMTGNYANASGVSREANWPKEALDEALAEIRLIESTLRVLR